MNQDTIKFVVDTSNYFTKNLPYILEQRDLLEGQNYAVDSYFNPIQDDNNNWIISTQEIDMCDNTDCLWVKNLPLIDYMPKHWSI